jgi:hypothetical protein
MAFNYAILLLAIHVTGFSRIGNRQLLLLACEENNITNFIIDLIANRSKKLGIQPHNKPYYLPLFSQYSKTSV